jgi:hypothetical protein
MAELVPVDMISIWQIQLHLDCQRAHRDSAALSACGRDRHYGQSIPLRISGKYIYRLPQHYRELHSAQTVVFRMVLTVNSDCFVQTALTGWAL